ncbi:MAG: hypothetical protein HY673_02815 [Chloroflexi bacterium]|nr:hypothetical protein [Chloroflexota bacterium]
MVRQVTLPSSLKSLVKLVVVSLFVLSILAIPPNGTVTAQQQQPLTLQAFSFRIVKAPVPVNSDAVGPSDVLSGKRGWRFDLQNTDGSPVPVTNATIRVESSLNPTLFPDIVSFPAIESTASLAPGQTLAGPRMENSNLPASFTPGYAASRAMNPMLVPPGGGSQTVTVRVRPVYPRYDYPRAHIVVGIAGDVTSTSNPDLSAGETLDMSPTPPSNGAVWMLHGAKIGKDYVFTAVLQVNNGSVNPLLHKPIVTVEMTSHRGVPLDNIPGRSIITNDADLQGRIIYSVNEESGVWHRIVDDYFVVEFAQIAREMPPVNVRVDIKPGSDPNSINLNQKGLVAVAILTVSPGQATPQFPVIDATSLNPQNIRIMDAADHRPGIFPNGAAPVRSATEDVDGDGDLDLVLHFETQDLVDKGLFDKDTTRARVYGPAGPGVPPTRVTGTDSVNIVGR